MKKIVLVCAGGMSTSVLVNNMKNEAKKKQMVLDIDAFPIDSVSTVGKDADCILLGPQVAYREAEVRGEVSCPVATIDMRSYGMMDGEKVLNHALTMMEG